MTDIATTVRWRAVALCYEQAKAAESIDMPATAAAWREIAAELTAKIVTAKAAP